MVKNNKAFNVQQFNLDLTPKTKNTLFFIIILALIILLFRKSYGIQLERVLLIIILFCLLLALTKNWLFSIIGTVILFLLFNLMMVMQMKNNNSIENFDNEKKDDLEAKKEQLKAQFGNSDIVKQITQKMTDYENDPNIQKAAGGIQELMKKLDGGIELKDSDTKETAKMDVPTEEFQDEKKNYPLKQAQKEVYELVNTIDTLKNTMETLAPVLSQGKDLMNMFENFKL